MSMIPEYKFTPRTTRRDRRKGPLTGHFFAEHIIPEWMPSSLSADEEDGFYTSRFRAPLITKEYVMKETKS